MSTFNYNNQSYDLTLTNINFIVSGGALSPLKPLYDVNDPYHIDNLFTEYLYTKYQDERSPVDMTAAVARLLQDHTTLATLATKVIHDYSYRSSNIFSDCTTTSLFFQNGLKRANTPHNSELFAVMYHYGCTLPIYAILHDQAGDYTSDQVRYPSIKAFVDSLLQSEIDCPDNEDNLDDLTYWQACLNDNQYTPLSHVLEATAAAHSEYTLYLAL